VACSAVGSHFWFRTAEDMMLFQMRWS